MLTGAVFSLSKGIIHEYYSVALAPATGALIGIGATVLWALRAQWWARVLLSTSVAISAWWAVVLLRRTPNWNSWLPAVIVVLAVASMVGLVVNKYVGRAAAAAALVMALAGPTAYAVNTVRTPHTGSLPTAGPATGGGFGPGRRGGLPGAGQGGGATGGLPGAGQGGQGGFPGGPGGGRGGGLMGGRTVSSAVSAFLQQGAQGYTWTLATVGATGAAPYQLASGEAVMAIGGFNGTDEYPTLAQFQALVKAHKVHYYLADSGGFRPTQGRGPSSAITTWVSSNFTTVTVDGTTFNDLTQSTNG